MNFIYYHWTPSQAKARMAELEEKNRLQILTDREFCEMRKLTDAFGEAEDVVSFFGRKKKKKVLA